jgi:hypothetical protein
MLDPKTQIDFDFLIFLQFVNTLWQHFERFQFSQTGKGKFNDYFLVKQLYLHAYLYNVGHSKE